MDMDALLDPGLLVQVLIVAVLIHLFLRFVRETRGNRLVRGVLVGVLGGYLGLRVLADLLGAEELENLLAGSTSFLLVVLAIVFQTELRRGIALLGDRSLVGRLMQPAGKDSLAQVAKAAVSMSSQRIGALIAFERETSLRSYIEEGTPIDASVHARLLESLFHPGTALHDGAVIVKGDRIAAAGCFFPLPQDADLDASLGTRHRAAVGITEDTDCIVLVVSEETGNISIAREGQIASKIDPGQLEDSLRRILQRKESPRGLRRPSLLPRSSAGWRRELGWMLGSLLLASGILYLSASNLQTKGSITLRLTQAPVGGEARPAAGEILVLLPPNYMLSAPDRTATFEVEIDGKRNAVEAAKASLPGGVYDFFAQHSELSAATVETVERNLDVSGIAWGERGRELSFDWVEVPTLLVERIRVESFDVQATDFKIIAEEGDEARLDRENARFEPRRSQLSLRAPHGRMLVLRHTHQLDDGKEGSVPFESKVFAELKPTGQGQDERRGTLAIHSSFAKDVELVDGDVTVIVPLVTEERQLGTVTTEVALVSLDPARSAELEQYRFPAYRQQTVRVRLLSKGLLSPDELESRSPVMLENLTALETYVASQIYAFVDVAELEPGNEPRGLPIQVGLRTPDWRDPVGQILLEDGLQGSRVWPLDALVLELEGDRTVQLERVEPEGG